MTTHDLAGIEYAKLSEVKEGDVLRCDDGFTCMSMMAAELVVHKRADGTLWVPCRAGMHDLDGQCDDGDHIVGMYKVNR